MNESQANYKRLRIGHLNVFHLRNKVIEVGLFLYKPPPFHVFGISESRLSDSVSDDDVSIHGYSLFRRDAKAPGQTGVAAYVHQSITPLTRRRFDLESKDVESLWLEIKGHLNSPPLLVAFIYRNPAASFAWYDHFSHMLDCASVSRNDVLIMGDFNIDMYKPHPSWDLTMTSIGLEQLVSSPTRVTPTSSTLIDHILCNRSEAVKDVTVSDLSISDHFPISCEWLSKIPKTKKRTHTTVTYRCFKHFDKTLFLHDLDHAPFHDVFHESDPDKALLV